MLTVVYSSRCLNRSFSSLFSPFFKSSNLETVYPFFLGLPERFIYVRFGPLGFFQGCLALLPLPRRYLARYMFLYEVIKLQLTALHRVRTTSTSSTQFDEKKYAKQGAGMEEDRGEDVVLFRSVERWHGEIWVHPGRLTWNLRIHPWKRKIIFQTIIFRFYVHLPGCIHFFPW